MFTFIQINLKYIGASGAKIAGSLFSLLTLFLTFVSWDDMGITSKCSRLLILISIVLGSAIIAIVSLLLKKVPSFGKMEQGKLK